jgi:hypothetical protein
VPFTIISGLAHGTYELRLFANGGYTLLATGNTFELVPPTAALSASPGAVAPGGTVTAAWACWPKEEAPECRCPIPSGGRRG